MVGHTGRRVPAQPRREPTRRVRCACPYGMRLRRPQRPGASSRDTDKGPDAGAVRHSKGISHKQLRATTDKLVTQHPQRIGRTWCSSVTTQTGPATIASLGDPVNACHDHRGTVDVDRKRAVDDNGEHLVVRGAAIAVGVRARLRRQGLHADRDLRQRV